jgi:hypothetical protein
MQLPRRVPAAAPILPFGIGATVVVLLMLRIAALGSWHFVRDQPVFVGGVSIAALLVFAAVSGARAPKPTLEERVKRLEEEHDDELYPWKPW